MTKWKRKEKCGLYMILTGIVLFVLWILAEVGVWWFFGPETFWQRVFCFIILQLPFGLLTGLLCVAVFAGATEYIDQHVPEDQPDQAEETMDHRHQHDQ